MVSKSTLRTKAGRVRLLLFDVDGVLTDGALFIHSGGGEMKRFHIRDGTAIVWAHRAGLMTGLISARPSAATSHRAAQLAIRIVAQSNRGKVPAFEQILRDQHLTDEEVAFMGDDLLDLPILERVGLSAAPADAVPEVRRRVHFVSQAPGGAGAARELVELVLKAQDRWDALVAEYGLLK